MTQTQDEQNVQVPGDQTQNANPVANEQNVQSTTPDLSAVDVAPEAPAAEPTEQPAAPVAEQPTPKVQPEAQGSMIQEWVSTVTDTLKSGVETLTDTWKASVEHVQQIWEDAVNTGTEAVQQTMSTATQAGQEAVQWVVWATNDLKQGISDTINNAKNAQWIVESGKAVVQWTVWTTAQVAEKATSSAVNAAEWLVGGTVGVAGNVVESAWSVVQNSVNNVAWAVLPEQAAQKVADFQNKVSTTAQNLGTQAKDTLQETWQKAKWFFAGLWDNFKSGFSTKNANEIMQQASAPLEQPAAPAAPVTEQPAAPVAEQPAAPVTEQSAAPAPQQPAHEVQPGDVQQPTQTNPMA